MQTTDRAQVKGKRYQEAIGIGQRSDFRLIGYCKCEKRGFMQYYAHVIEKIDGHIDRIL